MSVKQKDELLASVKAILGDTPSDEGIALLEDISDTLDDTSKGGSTEQDKRIKELEQQVKDTDSMWRQKYADRFLTPSDTTGNENDDSDGTDDAPEEDNSPKNFNELFTDEN